MTPRRDMNQHISRAAAILEAQMARHQARMEQAMAAHQRRIEALERRIAELRLSREQAMKAMELRAAKLREARGRGKSPGGRRRRGEEGGEIVPAVPRPKPKPLTGAAAAPVE